MMTTAPGITTYTNIWQDMATTLPSLAFPTTIHLPNTPVVTDEEDEESHTDHPTKATKIHEAESEAELESTKPETTQKSTKELQPKERTTCNDQPIQVT
jgi:hypothetical protein